VHSEREMRILARSARAIFGVLNKRDSPTPPALEEQIKRNFLFIAHGNRTRMQFEWMGVEKGFVPRAVGVGKFARGCCRSCRYVLANEET
jgi:hypothetical protein